MPLIAVTRLRIRSRWFMPFFQWHAFRAARQARMAAGNIDVVLFRDAHRTFWTCTAWKDQEAMRGYMSAEPHRSAMGKLAGWCDEASVVHWTQESGELPTWRAAHERMQNEGRPSRVLHPSPDHLAYRIAAPPQPDGRVARAG